MSGRPTIPIDWSTVESLLMADCSGIEIASNLGIDKSTLYDACEREKGDNFTNYSTKFKQKGESLLRKAQYDVAMGDNKKGVQPDKSMLIWLGKNRLNQSDKQEVKSESHQSEERVIEW